MSSVSDWIKELNHSSKGEEEEDDDDSEDEDWVPLPDMEKELDRETDKEKAEVVDAAAEEEAKEKDKKRKADLWSSFLSDVGGPKRKAAKISAPLTEQEAADATSDINHPKSTSKPENDKAASAECKNSTAGNSSVFESISKSTDTVTVKKVYDFAGEEVVVTEEVSVRSKEAKQHDSPLKEELAESSASGSSNQNGSVYFEVLGIFSLVILECSNRCSWEGCVRWIQE